MGVMTSENGVPLSGVSATSNSGFIGEYGNGGSLASGYAWPNEKYYDKYQYGTSPYDFSRRKVGDGTGEMGPFKNVIYANNLSRYISSWYDTKAYFVSATAPWFYRGGAYANGTESGIFTFESSTGISGIWGSFRIVLTPND